MLYVSPENVEDIAPPRSPLLSHLEVPAAIIRNQGAQVELNHGLLRLLQALDSLPAGHSGRMPLPTLIGFLEPDPVRAGQLCTTLKQVFTEDCNSATALFHCPLLPGRKRRLYVVSMQPAALPTSKETASQARAATSTGASALLLCTLEPSHQADDGLLDFELVSRLRQALDAQEFRIAYQPKLSCTTGRIMGAEALMRWQHPTRGELAPSEFLPQMDASGLINEVGRWVLRTACAEFAALTAGQTDAPVLAVNVSGQQVKADGLVDIVRQALADSGLKASQLELELTETVLMDRADQVESVLQQLRQLGVRIAVDDFGTGYSSLSYLRRFPLTSVKIDRSFVLGIDEQPQNLSIVRAVIGMARSLNLETVAEGVETKSQLGILVANGCDAVQGFLFSPAVDGPTLRQMLIEGRRLQSRLIDRDASERTLLIVDDEPNVRNALRRALRRAPYQLLFAASGAEALQLMAENAVDVVLSDQRMPEMTGVELLTRVKAIHPDTIRLVLSGFADLASVTDAINQGAVYKYLTKPWDDNLLLANLDAAFRQKALVDENRRLLQDQAAPSCPLPSKSDPESRGAV